MGDFGLEVMKNNLKTMRTRLIVSCLIGAMTILKVNASFDSRIELAEYYAIIEVLKHVNNPEVFVEPETNFYPVIGRAEGSYRNKIVGPQHVFLERYFGLSNVGFKAYVNLAKSKVSIVAFGRDCKEVNWKGFDGAMKDSKDWGIGENLDSLGFNMLDFILPAAYRIVSNKNGKINDWNRCFGKNSSVEINGELMENAKPGTQIWAPSVLSSKGFNLIYVVSPDFKRNQKRLRFLESSNLNPIMCFTRNFGGSFSGRRVSFDFGKSR